MRIPTLLQKISELAEQPDRRSAIDVDLMLDYTRVLYADLLEWRSRLATPGRQTPAPAPTNTVASRPVAAPVAEPAPQSIPKPTPAFVPDPVASTLAKPAGTPAAEPVPSAATKPASAVTNPAIPPIAPVIPPGPMSPIHEPTLAELAAAMAKSTEEEDEDDHSATAAQRKVPLPQRPATNIIPDTQTRPTKTKTTLPDPEPQTPKPQTPKTGAAAGPKDIRAIISINEKYQIMSELFGNDKAAYEDALNNINSAENEAAALKWLQDRLRVTEERSDAVQYFFDLVRRFKSPEQGFLGFS